jgi:hypothetical protein
LIKSTSIPRRWGDARAKMEEEGRCRVCGEGPWNILEAAHVIGRRCDPIMQGERGGQYRYVHPDSIVPLCKRCHASYDRRELDLLPFMFWPEQVRAVEDAGGVMSALKRVSPMGGEW